MFSLVYHLNRRILPVRFRVFVLFVGQHENKLISEWAIEADAIHNGLSFVSVQCAIFIECDVFSPMWDIEQLRVEGCSQELSHGVDTPSFRVYIAYQTNLRVSTVKHLIFPIELKTRDNRHAIITGYGPSRRSLIVWVDGQQFDYEINGNFTNECETSLDLIGVENEVGNSN